MFSLLTEPSFGSEIERRFVMLFVDECESNNAIIWHYLNLAFWAFAAPVGFLFGFDRSAVMVLAVAGAILFTASALTLRFVRTIRKLRLLQLALYPLCVAAMYIAMRVDIMDGERQRGLAALWIVGSALGTSILAFRSRVHFVTWSYTLILMALGFRGYPDPIVGWSIGATLVSIASCIQIAVHRAIKIEAIKSFRQQTQFTPRQIIIRAIENRTTVAKVFPTQERFCVCICSDWRSFQPWTMKTQSTEIAEVLTSYYESQARFLEEAFPKGNYFLDWIADELFAVAFASSPEERREIVLGAVAFAKRSLAAREDFLGRHGAPIGLDIGISVGMATVGILGPEGNMKATAIGEPAGRARRIQTAAKDLRKHDRSVDRLLIDGAAAAMIDVEAHGLVYRRLSAEILVKDLDQRDVLVWEQEHVAPSKDEAA